VPQRFLYKSDHQGCARDLLSRDRDETETRRCSSRDAQESRELQRLAETFSVTYPMVRHIDNKKNYTN